MSNQLQPVRGTHDLLGQDFAAQQYVIEQSQQVASLYGYGRIDTPMFEFSEVFHRAVGDTSDIVTKETYTFTDRGGESITLRPEFTAAVVRAFISNGQQQHVPWKCFYAGPAFRYERPQKGRQRQFHQIGAELLGANEPMADVEMITLAHHTLSVLGLSSSVVLELNSLCDPESRKAYREALVTYFTKHQDQLSEDSQVRLAKNPLRILDSKDAQDRVLIGKAPKLENYANEASRAHFAAVKAGLDALGITYKVNPALVRGLDYYSHTVFEFTTDKLGAQGTVLAGGRYDGLVKLMGGQDIPGIGFAAGIERLAALMAELKTLPPQGPVAEILVVPMAEEQELDAWKLAQALRQAGFAVDIAYKGKAGKRLARADKLGARVALMLGAEEVAKQQVTMKELESGVQNYVSTAHGLNELVKLLKN